MDYGRILNLKNNSFSIAFDEPLKLTKAEKDKIGIKTTKQRNKTIYKISIVDIDKADQWLTAEQLVSTSVLGSRVAADGDIERALPPTKVRKTSDSTDIHSPEHVKSTGNIANTPFGFFSGSNTSISGKQDTPNMQDLRCATGKAKNLVA